MKISTKPSSREEMAFLIDAVFAARGFSGITYSDGKETADAWWGRHDFIIFDKSDQLIYGTSFPERDAAVFSTSEFLKWMHALAISRVRQVKINEQYTATVVKNNGESGVTVGCTFVPFKKVEAIYNMLKEVK